MYISDVEINHNYNVCIFQVFLLDTQVKKDIDHEIESEADKSFVLLLYKPGDDASLNPDDIVTR
jgi:hypothetical protein